MNRAEFVKTFETYVSNYDLNDPKIHLKYVHTGKVAENCERIALSLKLPPEDVEIAWEIGMLHDIGRFEQLRRFDTFMDSISIDHAEFGAELLFREGLIAGYEPDERRYALIEKAIRNHSKYRLPEGLEEREVLFCQIIRDADKVDIYRANFETGMEDIYNVTTRELKQSGITPEVYEAFQEEHAILRSLKKQPADHIAGHLALAFELVYPESKVILKEQGYLWRLADFETENPMTRKILADMKDRLKTFLG